MTGVRLHHRLFQLVLIAMLATFVVHLVIEIRGNVRLASEHSAADTQDVASAAVPLLKSAMIVGDLATAQETLDNIARHGHFVRLQLLEPEGIQVLTEGRVPQTRHDQAPGWFITLLDIRFEAQRFPVEAGGVRYGILVVEPSAAFLTSDIWERLWTSLLVWLIVIGTFGMLLRFALRHALRPVAELADAAHRLGEGDLGARAPVGDIVELANTAQAFNSMANRLAEAQTQLEARVRQATRDLEHLIMQIPVGVFKLRVSPGDTMHLDFVSPRWLELIELDESTVRDNPTAVMEQVHPEDVDNLRQSFDAAQAIQGDFQWEGRLRPGLRVRWIHLEATPTLLDSGDTLWEGIQYDISDAKEREEELDRIAHFDALTGIPNRILLADRLQQAIAQAQRNDTALAVCFLDLDGFKPVNDALGHDAGDALLVEIARRLHANLRGGDTVARIGGDEFVLLLSGMKSMDEYETTLGRILETINAPVQLDKQQVVSVSASIGIALYPKDNVDPDLLLRHADQAMYQAKQAGRNKFIFFDPNVEDAARRHRHLLRQIEDGLSGREFELYYQPKVNMRLGTVIGFEALVRWRHPERGILLPEEFLPLIEDNDLIVALGEWVIDNALTQLATWKRRGVDLSVSVNVAPRHLQHGDFAARLRQRLSIHADAPAEKLEIEVVETAALADTVRVAELIDECKKLGVTFALDDFGTGYSSLSYLKSLPARTLKIDQSFVRDMLVDANDLAIVEGVIGLTEVFHRQVVAEGVETTEHGTLLLNMGCELAQGFGIAPPMPVTEVDEWLRTWRPDPTWSAIDGVRWPRDDLPLVIAESNHRAWVETVANYVNDATTELPELDSTQCRFGQWYAGNGRRRYGIFKEYAAIAPLHDQVHVLGGELIALVDAGRSEEARARLAELFALRDELLNLLQQLMTTAATTL